METPSAPLRHVVARLPAARLATCGLLWVGLLVPLLAPREVPLWTLAPLVMAAALLHALVLLAPPVRGTVPAALAGFAIVVDVLLLAALVHLTGGVFNPFVVIFAVYTWLAWVTLASRWGVIVALVSSAAVVWLVLDHLGGAGAAHHRLSDLPTHLFTLWLSGMAVAELVGHYVARASANLSSRQRLLEEARERAARSERLASLTTLAAGAAHELSTPLGTIAVAARELERIAARVLPHAVRQSVADDARLIRTEVDRCQIILDRMSGRARSATDAAGPLDVQAIVARAAASLPDTLRPRLRIEIDPHVRRPAAAGDEAAQAVSSLLKNAFDASGDGAAVRLRVTSRGAMVRIEVHDSGAGFSPETIRRAGEPFYTTKEPGKGLGLGLFLARTFAERVGGSLQLASGDETVATLELPGESAAVAVAS